MRSIRSAVLAVVFASFGFSCLAPQSWAGNAKADSDVIVQRHPDGTVDVCDKPQAASQSQNWTPSSAQQGMPPVIYHLRNKQDTRTIGGVQVRTNSDGSIETFDSESACSTSRAASHSTTAHRRRMIAQNSSQLQTANKSKSASRKTH